MFDGSFFDVNDSNLSTRISQTVHYLEEYEKEVKRAEGASGYVFRNKEEALGRIKILCEFAPNDPRVKDLYNRARACVKGGAGNFTTVTSEMTQYLVNEEELRRHFSELSETAWNELLVQNSENRLEKIFPTPDMMEYTIEQMEGKIVVLDSIRYPENQFMGTAGEFIWTGTRSDGMYFLRIDTRKWLGPYEAVKRYRRQVDTTLMEIKEWTVLGKIVDIAMEFPEAGERKIGAPVMAWVVEPMALYVPGHVLALYEKDGEHTGKFVGEETVEDLKAAWYTVKEIPDDVTPERLVEIFMWAIKEKNYNLYKECIEPERRDSPLQEDLLMYHWDLHQERFHLEYVHANIDPEKTKITVVQGYKDSGIDSFFLDEEDQKEIAAAYGDKVEEAVVYTTGFDKNGKQLGSPAGHTLVRTNGGRWYIRTYEVRF